MSWHGRLRRDQSGWALAEVLASMLVVGLGILGSFGTFEASGNSTLNSQRTEQAVAIGQQAIEKLKAVPYAQLGLSSLPSYGSAGGSAGDPNDPADPNSYVNGSDLQIKADWHDDTSATLASEPLVGGGSVSPGPDPVASGPTQAEVYRFVSQHTETCQSAISAQCSGGPLTAKRITVAVVLDSQGGFQPSPVWLSTLVTDPDAGPGDTASAPTASPGSGPGVTAQPFFLHDTPCSQSSRQAITGSHATHDTGAPGAACSSSTPPDLMDPYTAPDGDSVPVYDYSDDLGNRSTPQEGLALKRGTSSTCDAGSAPYAMHTWATPPFASAFSTPSSGARSAFSFWTRTVGGVSGPATLCLTLRLASEPATPLLQTSYHLNSWPANWTQLSFAFDGPQGVTIATGDRLEVSLSLLSTSGEDVELMYDHPQYHSFLTVGTTTPLG